MEKRMTFKEFVKITREAEKNGIVTHSGKLTDLDLAVQFAACRLAEKKGYPFCFTAEEVTREILQFAPQLLLEGEE